MAILSNINGKFAVDSSGGIQFSGQTGTAGYVLKSNGNAAPTWVAASTVIGGPYLPLSGGTLTGATATATGISFTVGGILTGTTATFAGSVTSTKSQNTATSITVSNTNTGSLSQARFVAVSDSGNIQLKAVSAANTTYGAGDSGVINCDTMSGGLRFAHNDVVKMTIDTSGNVGIGTSSPGSQLEIKAPDTSGSPARTVVTRQLTLNANGGNNLHPYEGFGTGIIFEGYDYAGGGGTSGPRDYAYIDSIIENSGSTPVDFRSQLKFHTNPGGSSTQTPTVKMVIEGGGNVGIGTTSPSAFDSVGADNLVVGPGTGNNGITVYSATTGYGALAFADGNASASSDQYRGLIQYNHTSDTFALFTNATTKMTILSSGNVGIGNTAPGAKLTVGTNAHVNATGIEVNAGNGGGNILALGSTHHNWLPYTNGYNYYSAVGHYFRNETHGTVWMTITSAGNVGIGTSSPGYKLSVANASTRIVSINYQDSINTIMSHAGAPNYGLESLSVRGDQIYFYTDYDTTHYQGVEQMRLTSYGQLLINATSSAYGANAWGYNLGVMGDATQGFISVAYGTQTLDSNGMIFGVDATQGYVWNRDNTSLALGTNNTQRVTITGDGNVGIGTTSPTNYKFDVNGTVKGDSFSVEGASARIFAPSGATYNGSGTQTGYLIIKLPDNGASGINNMMTGLIRVFDYTSNESFDIHFAGYWYAGYNWTNCTAWIDSAAYDDRNFNVMFGGMTGSAGAGSRPYLLIGESTSTWTYCKFSVINYEPGHSNYQAYKWDSGWNMDLSVTNPGTVLRTINNPQTNNWARTGQDLYYGSGSGNVGIGTTSPDAKLDVYNSSTSSVVVAKFGAQLYGSANNTYIEIGTQYADGGSRIGSNNTSGNASSLMFETMTTTSGVYAERMRITSAGDVLIGRTSKTDTPAHGSVYISGDYAVGGTNYYAQVFVEHASVFNHGIVIKELGASGIAMGFLNSSGTVVGSISTAASSTAFNTSSDYRLKENVVEITGALDRVIQLKPNRFNFIADPDKTVDGFLAHEVQEVVPEAITGEKDGVDKEGNPVYQGIDQSKLVPLLVKSIQELEARVKELENK